MRLITNLAAFAILAIALNVAAGQTLLERIEGKLKPGGAKTAAEAPPATSSTAGEKGYLGFIPDETTTDNKGVLVVSTKPGAPAEQGGLKKGDLITQVDGKPIKSVLDLDPLLDKATVGQKMRITVERAGKQVPLNLTFGKRPPKTGASATVSDPGTASTPNPPSEDPLSPPSLTPPAGAPSLEPPATDPPATAPADAFPPATTDPAETPRPIRSKPLTLSPPTGDDPAAEPRPADPASDPASPAPRSIFDPSDPSVPSDPSTPAPGTPALSDPADASPAITPAEAAPGGRPSLGITVLPLTDEARSLYGLTVREGALITGVRPGSPADVAGLPVGGCVVAIDGRRIDSADDLVAAIRGTRAGQEVELTYYDGPTLARKNVRLAPSGTGIVAGTPPPPAVGESVLGTPRTDRPLLGRIEGVVDSIARRGPSTVYDPSEMAAMRDHVLRLEKLVEDLEARVKALEGNSGAPAPAPGTFGGAEPAP